METRYDKLAEAVVDYIYKATNETNEEEPPERTLLQRLRAYSNRPFDDYKKILPLLSEENRKAIEVGFDEQRRILTEALKTEFPLQDPVLIRKEVEKLNHYIKKFLAPIRKVFIWRFEIDVYNFTSELVAKYSNEAFAKKALKKWENNLRTKQFERESPSRKEEDHLLSVITDAYTFHLIIGTMAEKKFPKDKEEQSLSPHQYLMRLLLPTITDKPQANYYGLFLESIQAGFQLKQDHQEKQSHINITYLINLQKIVGKLAVEQFFEWLGKDYHYILYSFPKLFEPQPKADKLLIEMQQIIFTGFLSFADRHKFSGNREMHAEDKQDFLKKLMMDSKETAPKFSKVVEKKLRAEKLKEKKLKGKKLKEEKNQKGKVVEEKKLFHKKGHGFLFKSNQSKSAQQKKPPTPFIRQHKSEENLNRFHCARPNRSSISLPSDCLDSSVELKLNKG